MRFRTEYKPSKADLILSPGKPVVLAGSCFSQNMASKMRDHLWTAVNPMGTLYNPYSICRAIKMMMSSDKGVSEFEGSLFLWNGVWNSHFFDSSFSFTSREDCISEFKLRQQEFLKSISEGNTLIVTFGTAICYCHVKEDILVGNCHKLPSQFFIRKRLSVEDISILWGDMIKALQEEYPDIKIIFTVSPVRHLKDGFSGNACSKAILMLAVEEICNGHKCCSYFPAYEILNDDLRDYRFYASDLVHPSEEGIEYIWEIFQSTYLNEEGEKLLKEGERKVKASRHRPIIRKGQHP